jgi:hypothetical protein
MADQRGPYWAGSMVEKTVASKDASKGA